VVFEDDLQPQCVAQGVGLSNFHGPAAGFLAGRYRRPEDADKGTAGKAVVTRWLNERRRLKRHSVSACR
jgi:aryl-alcohol dehydrogenase-like predicted oxidoreductase